MARPTTTYNNGDLIQQPAYVIESLIRDEIHTERDLVIDAISTANITFDGTDAVNNPNGVKLKVTVDDFYNNSYLVNVTRSERYLVSDYVGSTRTLTLNSTPSGWADGDKCYLKNVNCTIDTDTFDAVGAGQVESGTTTSTSSGKLIQTGQNFLTTVLAGMRVFNSTDNTYSYVKSVDSNTQLTLMDDIMASGETYSIYGVRNGWLFDRSLTSKQSSQQILEQLAFESHCMLYKAVSGYKLIPLEGGHTVGTLDTPLYQNGKVLISTELTSLLNIYTDFTLNYGYNYAKRIYTKQVIVNSRSVSDSSLDDLRADCESAEQNYKVNRKWEYNSDWIQDDTTAINFIRLIVESLTYQRMIVNWTGDISNHIQYEIGDRVLIDYDYMMPTGKNNSTIFLITGLKIDAGKKKVQLQLTY